MKIVGLLAFKNEEHYLPDCLTQLLSLCDLVLGHDDSSTDNSVSIFKDLGGVLIPNCRSLPWGNGGEFQVREGLLNAGRMQGGTHFICLDADELFTFDIAEKVRAEIMGLPPGSALCYQWISCWLSETGDQVLQDLISSRMKDFAFADDGQLKYPVGKMHISRTPTLDSQKLESALSDRVLHLQFVDHQNYLAKQFWYQLSEILYSNYPHYYVDYKYLKHMKRPKSLVSLDSRLGTNLTKNFKSRSLSQSNREQILDLLSSLSKKSVCYLDLWRFNFLRDIYVSAYGSEPPKKTSYRIIVDYLRLLQFVARSKMATWRSRNAR